MEKALTLVVHGPIKGGKNNLIVLRNGMHIPRPKWKAWRDVQVILLKAQNKGQIVFTEPCRIRVRYWKADLRRRDVAAMIDSLCHCLERAGIVKDDSLLEAWAWEPEGLDRATARAEILISSPLNAAVANGPNLHSKAL